MGASRKKSQRSTDRINIRLSPGDVAMFEQIDQLAPQSRTDIIRNALIVARRHVSKPIVLVNAREEQKILPFPNQRGTARGTKMNPIQIRQDREMERMLDDLTHDGKFGSNKSAVIRNSIVFFCGQLGHIRLGYQAYHLNRNAASERFDILAELGIEFKYQDAPQKWFPPNQAQSLKGPVEEEWFPAKIT